MTTIRVISVPVNYTMTFAEMATAGDYDMVSPQMVPLFSQIRLRISGMVDLFLLFFEEPPLVTNGELFRHLRSIQKRAAETAEILALGARYPNLQREFPMVAFGSPDAHCNGGHARYPSLDEFEGKRRLVPLWDDPYLNFRGKKGAILAVSDV